jgi:NCS1 family nucleobase:cation symporter-1
VWAVLGSLLYLTWWALDGSGFGGLWDRSGEGGLSVWQGVDLVVAITVSWIPLAADYTRFARDRASALWGTGVGYLLPSVWLWCLGAVLFFSRDLTEPAALPAAVAAGGIAATLALLAVTVDETDEAFANVYSTAVSIQNLAPRLPQRALVTAVAAVATLGALTIDLLSYQTFLLLLGSFFVPLFGVLLADWLVAGARYREEDVFGGPAIRPGMIGAWIAGFAAYQWLYPTGPQWWVDLVSRLDPPDVGIGATVPSFVVSFALAGAIAALGKRRF